MHSEQAGKLEMDSDISLNSSAVNTAVTMRYSAVGVRCSAVRVGVEACDVERGRAMQCLEVRYGVDMWVDICLDMCTGISINVYRYA